MEWYFACTHLAKRLVKENEYLAEGNFLNDNSNQKWGFNV